MSEALKQNTVWGESFLSLSSQYFLIFSDSDCFVSTAFGITSISHWWKTEWRSATGSLFFHYFLQGRTAFVIQRVFLKGFAFWLIFWEQGIFFCRYAYCFVLDKRIRGEQLSNHAYHTWLCSSWSHSFTVTPEKVWSPALWWLRIR